jgi:prolyl oligopeptidase
MHAAMSLRRAPCSSLLPLLFAVACGGSPRAADETTAAQSTSADDDPRAPSGPPVAAVRPVSTTYHGETVVDPYQWLESPDDAEVRAWSDAQNAWARSKLAALPHRDAIRTRVTEILSAPTRSHRSLVHAGGKIFAIERRPPREQPFLVVMSSADAPDEARVLVDPTAIDESGQVAIDWFVPSQDGALVAVSLSRGGTERGDVHVYDVATGQRVHEIVEHVQNGTAGGDVAWMPDNSGFFYTRYPRAGDEHANDADFHQQVWFHRFGTEASEDRYEIGREFPRIAEIQFEMHAASGRLLATVQNGDGGEFSMHLRERDGRWRTFAAFEDQHVQATFGPRDDLYVVSRKGAPRGKILRVPIRQLDVARGTLVVPEGEHSIVTDFWDAPTVYPTRNRLYVMYQTGGPSELRVFDLRGRAQTPPAAPPVSAVRALAPLGGDDLLFRVESYVTPPVWMHLDGRTGEARETALRETSPVDPSGWEVRREMATSRDGTQVPLNILAPRGIELDGTHPCIVNGYGGYGVNIEPRFNAERALYLDNGVIYVIANLRGGAEFGEAWHAAGSLEHKQNVFDDFAAAIQHVIDRRYTSTERLAIIGGSNGGLLMGATLTQHPELVRAVVSFVGIYDMLRVELSPNGAFNVTEFGTVTNEVQYRALRAYSPYHNVRDGVRYPATLFLTGANDPRVEPWHSRKMTARLQAAQSGDAPILLRTSDNSGHGLDTPLSEEIEESTDVISFLFAALDVAPR